MLPTNLNPVQPNIIIKKEMEGDLFACSEVISEPLLFQLFEFQKLLNIQLLKNIDYIDNFLSYRQSNANSKKGQSYTGSTSDGVNISQKRHSGYQTIIKIKSKAVICQNLNQNGKNDNKRKEKKIMKKTSKAQFDIQDSDYNPENEYNTNQKHSASSQSKNVPKNMSKAILLFIKKKQSTLTQLLQQLHIDKNQFMQAVMELKGKINAISKLRSIWIDQQNKHARIFRILSNYYLRKHSLNHIFNSRVIEFSKHLKYRQKIMQVLKNPIDFTYMKDY